MTVIPTFEKCRLICEFENNSFRVNFKFTTNRARRALTDGVTQSQTEADLMLMYPCNYLFLCCFISVSK